MFGIIHLDGSGDDGTSLDVLSPLYDELLTADFEHGDVAVVHEQSGWCISAHRDGRVVFGHLGEGGDRHMIPVTKEQVLILWRRLIDGDINDLLAEPWVTGYGE